MPVATSDLRDELQAALGTQYMVQRELGRGGMATVYLAEDAKHHRSVALKVLHADLAANLGPERFQREIAFAAKLQHPHILTVLDSGETPSGLLWFTMPYVEGESLRDRLRRQRQLPLDDALRITREIARALDYAHRHSVIHRELESLGTNADLTPGLGAFFTPGWLRVDRNFASLRGNPRFERLTAQPAMSPIG